jgi:hypothetical protein
MQSMSRLPISLHSLTAVFPFVAFTFGLLQWILVHLPAVSEWSDFDDYHQLQPDTINRGFTCIVDVTQTSQSGVCYSS